MYTVSVKEEFIARHFLVGGDWGAENQEHSHDYKVVVRLEGDTLNQHGYLIDIIEIKKQMETVLSGFRGRTLNQVSQFEGLNPSLEHFARIFCQSLLNLMNATLLSVVTVEMWEDEGAWAAYRREL